MMISSNFFDGQTWADRFRWFREWFSVVECRLRWDPTTVTWANFWKWKFDFILIKTTIRSLSSESPQCGVVLQSHLPTLIAKCGVYKLWIRSPPAAIVSVDHVQWTLSTCCFPITVCIGCLCIKLILSTFQLESQPPTLRGKVYVGSGACSGGQRSETIKINNN